MYSDSSGNFGRLGWWGCRNPIVEALKELCTFLQVLVQASTRAGFLSLASLDILHWIILCCVQCDVQQPPWPLPARHHLPQHVITKDVSRHGQISPGGVKSPLIKNHWTDTPERTFLAGLNNSGWKLYYKEYVFVDNLNFSVENTNDNNYHLLSPIRRFVNMNYFILTATLGGRY